MIVVMKKNAHQEDVQRVVEYIEQAGLRPHLSDGSTHTIIGVIGAREAIDVLALEALPGVEKAVPVSSGLNLVSRLCSISTPLFMIRTFKSGPKKHERL